MTRQALLSALLLGSTSLPALALDFGNGFSATGEFELEYFDAEGSSGEFIGYGTTDLSVVTSSGFGGFVGFDAFSLDGDDGFAAYAALSYQGSFGKVQIGAPRAALDDYVDTPTLGGLRFFDLFLGGRTSSVLTNIYLLSDLETPLGLRYDGTFGDLKVGVSYHSIEDAEVFDLAANYQLGSVVLRGGIEALDEGGSGDTAVHLGAETTFSQFRAGLLYSDNPLFASKIAQVYGVYSLIDQLNVTATLWSVNPDIGSSENIYGLSADYTFAQGAYVEGGIADGDESPSILNASIGVKF